MRFKPEAGAMNEDTSQLPDAEPGEYTMRLSAYRPAVKTAKGERAVIDFAAADCRSSMWVAPPEPAKGKAGNAWKFGMLAKALGQKARDQYMDTDDEGFSKFDPGHYIGWIVSVMVGEYGVERVLEITDTEGHAFPDEPQHKTESIGDPQNTDDGRHDDGANDDDIPF